MNPICVHGNQQQFTLSSVLIFHTSMRLSWIIVYLEDSGAEINVDSGGIHLLGSPSFITLC